MRKVFFRLLGTIVFGMLFLSACTPAKLLWFSSSGIMTYNRATGQLEVLWENQGQGQKEKCETIYVYHNEIVPAERVPQ